MVQNAAHSPSVINTDEGGFNEPSPEIKAKLKPAYTYETTTVAQHVTEENDTKDTTDTTDDSNQHSLHYVDFGYRLNPDGSESKQCFSEERYDIAQNNNGNCSGAVERQRCDKRTVHYPVADSVVYAAIKSEPSSSLSSPFEPKFNCGGLFLHSKLIIHCICLRLNKNAHYRMIVKHFFEQNSFSFIFRFNYVDTIFL